MAQEILIAHPNWHKRAADAATVTVTEFSMADPAEVTARDGQTV